MKIAILAAGYGTRLYPLTLNIAKPLLPVNNKPMINYLLDKIEGLKDEFIIDGVRIVVNHKFYESFLTWQEKYKVKATILDDGSTSPDDRLGAIKDMQFAISDSQDDWLVLGGDNLFEDDLKDFSRFAAENKPNASIGLYDVGSLEPARRFGIVELNQESRIVRFDEKPKEPRSTLAASCIYFFPKESLRLLGEFIRGNDADASGKYIAWLVKNDKVFGYTLRGEWIDIGHFDSLKEAEKKFGR